MWVTLRGDNLTYDGLAYTPTPDLETSTLHWNIFLLTPGSKYLAINVKIIYLNNLVLNHEYYRISLSLILKSIIDKYDLMENHIDGFNYFRVEK